MFVGGRLLKVEDIARVRKCRPRANCSKTLTSRHWAGVSVHGECATSMHVFTYRGVLKMALLEPQTCEPRLYAWALAVQHLVAHYIPR